MKDYLSAIQALSWKTDVPHCSDFLDKLREDLLLLTAESQDQLGLTPSNPLGHLETPTTQLARIIPHPPTHEPHTY